MHTTVREALLSLHRALIEHERRAWEKTHGRTTPAEFLQVVVREPALAWLAPLTGVIARLDEIEDGEFAANCAARVQQDPDVAFAYARAQRALRAPSPAPR